MEGSDDLEERMKKSEAQLNQITHMLEDLAMSVSQMTNREARKIEEPGCVPDSELITKFTPQIFSTPKVDSSRTTSLLKAKDVDILKITDLSSIHSKAARTSFFKQVRLVTNNPQEQVDVALNKLEKPLSMVVTQIFEQKCLDVTLENLEKILVEEYPGPRSMADAIRELYQLEYHIEHNPRTFYHNFITQFSLLCQTFPRDSPPSRTPVFKNIVMRKLPADIQRRLSIFNSEGYSEELFLEELEKERMSAKLRQEIVSEPEMGMGTVSQISQNGNRDQRNKGYQREPTKNVNNYPCRYCQNGQRHTMKECPRNPPIKSCFDCLSVYHQKGDPSCSYSQCRLGQSKALYQSPPTNEYFAVSQSVRPKANLPSSESNI